ncbi:MAG: tRNA1(Val) (adenine(37)-N6)-methyltransferase [Mycoplasmatales bacterium]
MKILNDLKVDGSLKIYQDPAYCNYTMDSLLLFHFIKITKKMNKCVELCSGNGAINLLLGSTYPELDIRAVEIQEQMSYLNNESIKINNLLNIKTINKDLINISKEIGSNQYQLVVCNPPYFKVDEDSNINPSSNLAIARHEILVSIEQIIEESRILLDNKGSLYIVFRPQRIVELTDSLLKNGFVINTIQYVHPFLDKPATTVLIEAKKGTRQDQTIVKEPIIVYEEQDKYTTQVEKIINF